MKISKRYMVMQGDVIVNYASSLFDCTEVTAPSLPADVYCGDILDSKTLPCSTPQPLTLGSRSLTFQICPPMDSPHYATEADVKTADWQGLVSPTNPDQVMAITEVIADKAERMRNYYLETVEASLARALFKQSAKASKTDYGSVDFNAVFGTAPLDFELNGSAGANVYAQLAKIRRMLVKEYGASRSIWTASIALHPRRCMTFWRATRK